MLDTEQYADDNAAAAAAADDDDLGQTSHSA